MTVGGKQYNEADLLQMQRDAEQRVREMQSRARQTVEPSAEPEAQQRNRNWSSNPNTRRRPGYMRWPGPMGQPQQTPSASLRQEPRETHPDTEPRPEPPPTPPEPERAALPKKEGTIVGDIMDALGLDEDYLLIIGLILILVNQRADTTLILALAYLLI